MKRGGAGSDLGAYLSSRDSSRQGGHPASPSQLQPRFNILGAVPPPAFFIQNPPAAQVSGFPASLQPRGFPGGGVSMMGPGGHGSLMFPPFINFVQPQFYPPQSMMSYSYMPQLSPWQGAPPQPLPPAPTCSGLIETASTLRSVTLSQTLSSATSETSAEESLHEPHGANIRCSAVAERRPSRGRQILQGFDSDSITGDKCGEEFSERLRQHGIKLAVAPDLGNAPNSSEGAAAVSVDVSCDNSDNTRHVSELNGSETCGQGVGVVDASTSRLNITCKAFVPLSTTNQNRSSAEPSRLTANQNHLSATVEQMNHDLEIMTRDGRVRGCRERGSHREARGFKDPVGGGDCQEEFDACFDDAQGLWLHPRSALLPPVQSAKSGYDVAVLDWAQRSSHYTPQPPHTLSLGPPPEAVSRSSQTDTEQRRGGGTVRRTVIMRDAACVTSPPPCAVDVAVGAEGAAPGCCPTCRKPWDLEPIGPPPPPTQPSPADADAAAASPSMLPLANTADNDTAQRSSMNGSSILLPGGKGSHSSGLDPEAQQSQLESKVGAVVDMKEGKKQGGFEQKHAEWRETEGCEGQTGGGEVGVSEVESYGDDVDSILDSDDDLPPQHGLGRGMLFGGGRKGALMWRGRGSGWGAGLDWGDADQGSGQVISGSTGIHGARGLLTKCIDEPPSPCAALLAGATMAAEEHTPEALRVLERGDGLSPSLIAGGATMSGGMEVNSASSGLHQQRKFTGTAERESRDAADSENGQKRVTVEGDRYEWNKVAMPALEPISAPRADSQVDTLAALVPGCIPEGLPVSSGPRPQTFPPGMGLEAAYWDSPRSMGGQRSGAESCIDISLGGDACGGRSSPTLSVYSLRSSRVVSALPPQVPQGPLQPPPPPQTEPGGAGDTETWALFLEDNAELLRVISEELVQASPALAADATALRAAAQSQLWLRAEEAQQLEQQQQLEQRVQQQQMLEQHQQQELLKQSMQHQQLLQQLQVLQQQQNMRYAAQFQQQLLAMGAGFGGMGAGFGGPTPLGLDGMAGGLGATGDLALLDAANQCLGFGGCTALANQNAAFSSGLGLGQTTAFANPAMYLNASAVSAVNKTFALSGCGAVGNPGVQAGLGPGGLNQSASMCGMSAGLTKDQGVYVSAPHLVRVSGSSVTAPLSLPVSNGVAGSFVSEGGREPTLGGQGFAGREGGLILLQEEGRPVSWGRGRGVAVDRVESVSRSGSRSGVGGEGQGFPSSKHAAGESSSLNVHGSGASGGAFDGSEAGGACGSAISCERSEVGGAEGTGVVDSALIKTQLMERYEKLHSERGSDPSDPSKSPQSLPNLKILGQARPPGSPLQGGLIQSAGAPEPQSGGNIAKVREECKGSHPVGGQAPRVDRVQSQTAQPERSEGQTRPSAAAGVRSEGSQRSSQPMGSEATSNQASRLAGSQVSSSRGGGPQPQRVDARPSRQGRVYETGGGEDWDAEAASSTTMPKWVVSSAHYGTKQPNSDKPARRWK